MAALRGASAPPRVAELALRAMAERAAGRNEQAQRSFALLEEAARTRSPVDDGGFLAEARSVFGVSPR
jgi:hypothetical protein